MRKIICLGVLGAISCAAIFYLAAGYMGHHPESLLANGWGIAQKVAVDCNLINRLGEAVTAWTAKPTPAAAEELGLKEEDAVCVPEEPQPVDALLPDSAKLPADWQLLETIDLLRLQETSKMAKQEGAGKEPPDDHVPGKLSPEGFAPAAVRSADEAECFPLMPYCETPEPLPVMPSAEKTGKLELDYDSPEEQEAEPTEPVVDLKAIEEGLKRVLQWYLQEEKWPKGAGVDTMEFRPSDAKKGEFDRIPF